MGNDSTRDTGASPPGSSDRGRDGASGVPGPLLAAFAHEMRNALGPVRTAAYLLRASTTDAQAQWALDLIDRQVQAITASIDELADLARLTHGTLELGAQPIAFDDLLDGAESACATALAERRQLVDWARSAGPIAVRGDRVRLTQALGAVLRATSRATQTGSRIRIAVVCEAAEVATVIEGTPDAPSGAIPMQSSTPDTPSGAIPAPAPTGAAANTGPHFAGNVGLTLATEIVARHGGTLTASGRSRFAIRLPVIR